MNPSGLFPQAYQTLKVANQLTLKAFKSKNRESLIFIILNDTLQLIRYDRALLWDMTGKRPRLLGISGESKINKQSPLVHKWTEAALAIKEPKHAQVMAFSSQKGETDPHPHTSNDTMLWLPIFVHGSLTLGLWLELWGYDREKAPPQEMVSFMMNFLMPAYGTAWEKFSKPPSIRKKKLKKRALYSLLLAAFAGICLIQIPLRIVAPCEVVPKDPMLVTAPLEGIIDTVHIKPGNKVQLGDTLFEYNKEAPLQEWEVAKKQVQILQSEIKRASTLGFEDSKARADLAILSLKLAKEKANLELAEYRASQLIVKAEQNGVAIFDNSDQWRGKPVRVGEKILSIGDPSHSQVKIWLPESDNVPLDYAKNISIFLNINPEKKRLAKLTYIANESILSNQFVPSFVAEAEWLEPPEDIKLGLKGTAVLYGEKVSILYFILRKPLALLRSVAGL